MLAESGFTYLPGPSGILEKRMFIKYDNNKLHEFISFVGCGLTWFHWGKYLPVDCGFKVFTPSSKGLDFITKLFSLQTNLRIETQLGDGTVKYKGIMSESSDYISVWAVQLLGGITISDSNQKNVFHNSFVTMITGDKKYIHNLRI